MVTAGCTGTHVSPWWHVSSWYSLLLGRLLKHALRLLARLLFLILLMEVQQQGPDGRGARRQAYSVVRSHAANRCRRPGGGGGGAASTPTPQNWILRKDCAVLVLIYTAVAEVACRPSSDVLVGPSDAT